MSQTILKLSERRQRALGQRNRLRSVLTQKVKVLNLETAVDRLNILEPPNFIGVSGTQHLHR